MGAFGGGAGSRLQARCRMGFLLLGEVFRRGRMIGRRMGWVELPYLIKPLGAFVMPLNISAASGKGSMLSWGAKKSGACIRVNEKKSQPLFQQPMAE